MHLPWTPWRAQPRFAPDVSSCLAWVLRPRPTRSRALHAAPHPRAAAGHGLLRRAQLCQPQLLPQRGRGGRGRRPRGGAGAAGRAGRRGAHHQLLGRGPRAAIDLPAAAGERQVAVAFEASAATPRVVVWWISLGRQRGGRRGDRWWGCCLLAITRLWVAAPAFSRASSGSAAGLRLHLRLLPLRGGAAAGGAGAGAPGRRQGGTTLTAGRKSSAAPDRPHRATRGFTRRAPRLQAQVCVSPAAAARMDARVHCASGWPHGCVLAVACAARRHV